ncbi:hypothetical protein CBM2626_B120275 [Cupriavidus taiwanensis]|nr:hypothetical protein CBM2626_B120275 [Cupriavidus taiwanensis]
MPAASPLPPAPRRALSPARPERADASLAAAAPRRGCAHGASSVNPWDPQPVSVLPKLAPRADGAGARVLELRYRLIAMRHEDTEPDRAWPGAKTGRTGLRDPARHRGTAPDGHSQREWRRATAGADQSGCVAAMRRRL